MATIAVVPNPTPAEVGENSEVTVTWESVLSEMRSESRQQLDALRDLYQSEISTLKQLLEPMIAANTQLTSNTMETNRMLTSLLEMRNSSPPQVSVEVIAPVEPPPEEGVADLPAAEAAEAVSDELPATRRKRRIL